MDTDNNVIIVGGLKVELEEGFGEINCNWKNTVQNELLKSKVSGLYLTK